MNGNWVAVIIVVTLLLTTSAVILLRPITKKLGDLLEVVLQEKRQRLAGREPNGTLANMDALEQRLSLLEDRLEFTEKLMIEPARTEPAGLQPEPSSRRARG